MKTIELTQGKVALVDDEDFEWLNGYNWSLSVDQNGAFYAQNAHLTYKNKTGTMSMHRFVMRLDWYDGKQVDHRDHNTLNNQKGNLRVCTNQQNQFNKKSWKNASSRFKGVSFEAGRNKWGAMIRIDGKSTRIGRYNTELEAAKAYDDMAEIVQGEFAYFNLPEKRTT